MIAINSMPDHLHLFIGFRPNQSLSDLMRLVKGESSEWINKQQFTPLAFRWQEGYGAFSYSRSHVQTVTDYNEPRRTSPQKNFSWRISTTSGAFWGWIRRALHLQITGITLHADRFCIYGAKSLLYFFLPTFGSYGAHIISQIRNLLETTFTFQRQFHCR